jgi:hypothetical protein
VSNVTILHDQECAEYNNIGRSPPTNSFLAVHRYFSRKRFKAGPKYLAILAGMFVAGCAPTNNPDLHGLSASRFAQVQIICERTMELAPGNTRFDACLDSLSKTANALDQSRSHK